MNFLFLLGKENPSMRLPDLKNNPNILYFHLVSLQNRTKGSAFYTGRAECDYLNIMKEADFPKP